MMLRFHPRDARAPETFSHKFDQVLLIRAADEVEATENYSFNGLSIMEIISRAHDFDPMWSWKLVTAFSWYISRPRSIYRYMLERWHCAKPAVNRMLIRPPGPITAGDVQRWTADGVALSHVILFDLGTYCATLSIIPEQDQAWRELLNEVILAGCNLRETESTDIPKYQRKPSIPLAVKATKARASEAHLAGNRGLGEYERRTRSSLYVLLLGIVRLYKHSDPTYHGNKGLVARIRRGLFRSLMMLSSCGVDLQAFGTPNAILNMDDIDISIYHWTWNQRLRLKRIRYAARPQDWRMEWEFESSREDLVGDFWGLVETPVQNIPGAWPDSCSDDEPLTYAYADESDETDEDW